MRLNRATRVTWAAAWTIAIAVIGAGVLADTLSIPYKTKNPGDTIFSSHWTSNFQSIEDVVNGLISDVNIKNASVTGSTKLVDLSVTLGKLAADSVNSSKIVADSIVAGDIATDGVGTAEILDATIGTADIATGGVDTADLAASAATKGAGANTAALNTQDTGAYVTYQTVNITTTTANPALLVASAVLSNSSQLDVCRCKLTREVNGGGQVDVYVGPEVNPELVVAGFTYVYPLSFMDINGSAGTTVYRLACKDRDNADGTTCSFSERYLQVVELRR